MTILSESIKPFKFNRSVYTLKLKAHGIQRPYFYYLSL